ncbi:hypothetical protein PC116_g3794 [Phytophthora cactorum]|nr:hypothetical protein Pcac1_g28431 [Phytophthora cactorum]KAG2803978.1 hypothetical protein PC111_g18454 [Phytophthora cactorum]KAG2819455.1 hypothetical protein PC112_g12169 [Phytophthora cactorum]KAG2841566.1 hypothetical protein PC113_g19000 [Phytophthora cactorum]KAG2893062.1 hypothetical protein PC115_g18593 [Phytophthora cactorum]
MKMGPISTKKSEQVTTDRLSLELKCQVAEQKIMQTANNARNLIFKLDALASAVGAAPDEKVGSGNAP